MNKLEKKLKRLGDEVSTWLSPDAAMTEAAVRKARRARRVVTSAIAALSVSLAIVASTWISFGAAEGLKDGSDSQIGGPRIAEQIEVAGLQTLAAADGSVWVASQSGSCEGVLSRINSSTNAIEASTSLEVVPTKILHAFDTVWIAGEACSEENPPGSTQLILMRVDRETLTTLSSFDTGYEAFAGLTSDDDSIWVGGKNHDQSQGMISRIDPLSNQIEKRFDVTAPLIKLDAGYGMVWALVGGESPGLVAIDPETNRRDNSFAQGAWEVALADGYIWVPLATPPGTNQISLVRLDPETGSRVGEPISLGESVFAPLGSDDDGLWFIGGEATADLTRVNFQTLEKDASLQVADNHAVQGTRDSSNAIIWLADVNHERVVRVDTR